MLAHGYIHVLVLLVRFQNVRDMLMLCASAAISELMFQPRYLSCELQKHVNHIRTTHSKD